MSTEFFFFAVTAIVAVVAAVAMLLAEDNPVHSALFLVINFACVAFLYLLLDAPFLAMIQIAVYAGAIMVLFLFVIMLLGADKSTTSQRKFRWFMPVALFLSIAFLLTAGLALVGGEVSLLQSTSEPAMLRVIDVAADAAALDVYANSEQIAQNVSFRSITEYVSLPPGDYTLIFAPTGFGPELGLNAVEPPTVTLNSGDAKTFIVYGESLIPSSIILGDNLSAADSSRTAGITVFNGYSGAPSVTLVDPGLDGVLFIPDPDDQTASAESSDDKVIVQLAQGEITVIQRTPGESPLAFVDEQGVPIFQLRDFTVDPKQSQMIVLTGERLFDETLRPLALPLTIEALPNFGGPESVGQLLYTRYLLPFEMVAVLLLISMIGAIVLTHREDEPVRRRQMVRRKVSRPLTSVVAAQIGHDLDAKQLPSEVADEQPEPAGD